MGESDNLPIELRDAKEPNDFLDNLSDQNHKNKRHDKDLQDQALKAIKDAESKLDRREKMVQDKMDAIKKSNQKEQERMRQAGKAANFDAKEFLNKFERAKPDKSLKEKEREAKGKMPKNNAEANKIIHHAKMKFDPHKEQMDNDDLQFIQDKKQKLMREEALKRFKKMDGDSDNKRVKQSPKEKSKEIENIKNRMGDNGGIGMKEEDNDEEEEEDVDEDNDQEEDEQDENQGQNPEVPDPEIRKPEPEAVKPIWEKVR